MSYGGKPPPPPAAPLPAGWAMTYDQYGRPYFFNATTKETSWFPPVVQPPPQPQQQQQQMPPPPPPAPAPIPKQSLPPGWEQGFDAKSGRAFYIDHNTKTTSWNPPAAQQQASVMQPSMTQSAIYASPSKPGQLPQPVPVMSMQQPPQARGSPTPSTATTMAAAPYAPMVPSMFMSQPAVSGAYSPYGQPPQQMQPQMMMQQPTAPSAYMTSSALPPTAGYAPIVTATTSVMAGPPKLCTSKPTWTASALDAKTCPRCGSEFSLWKRKHQCYCCTREFCDTCTQKKALVPAISSSPSRVCDPCFEHLNKNNPKCLSRLVPYLHDVKEEVRCEALKEMQELFTAGGASASEVAGTGCLRQLQGCVSSKNPQIVALTASVITFASREPHAVEQLAEPAYSKSIVLAMEANTEVAPELASILAALAATEKGKVSLLQADVLKAISLGISSSNPVVVNDSVRVIELLSAGGGKCGQSDAETASVFALANCVMLPSTSPAVRLSAFNALFNLAEREDNRLALLQSDGAIKCIVDVLCDKTATPEMLRASLGLLEKLSHQTQIGPVLVPFIGSVLTLAKEPAFPGASLLCLKILTTLSQGDATQRSANQTLLLDHAASFVGLLTSPDVAVKTATLELLSSILFTHAEIAGNVFYEAGLIEPIAAVLRERTPATPLALLILGRSTHNNPEVGKVLVQANIVEVVLEMLNQGDREAANAIWAMTSYQPLGQVFVTNPGTLPALMQLLSRGDGQLSNAACGTLTNLVGFAGVATSACSAGISPFLAAMMTATNPDIQIQGMRALTAMASVDPVSADAVANTPTVPNSIATLCASNPNPALQYNGLSAAVVMAKSANFRSEFIRVNGMANITAACSSTDQHIKERAAAALGVFAAGGESDRVAIRACRGIPVLADLLFSDQVPLKIHAAAAITRFVTGNIAQDVVDLTNCGIVNALTGLLESQSPDELKEVVCQSLGSLVMVNTACRATAVEEGAVRHTLPLLNSPVDTLVAQALWLLRGLMMNNKEAAEQFNDANGVVMLQKVIDTKAALKEIASSLLIQISTASAGVLETYVQRAGLKILVPLLKSSNNGTFNTDAQATAVELLAKISKEPERRQELIATGVVQPVVALLSSSLSSTSTTAPNNKRDIQVNSLVSLVAFSEVPEARHQMLEFGILENLGQMFMSSEAMLKSGALDIIFNLSSDEANATALADDELVAHLLAALSVAEGRVKALEVLGRIGRTPVGAAVIGQCNGIIPALLAMMKDEPTHAPSVLSLLSLIVVAAPSTPNAASLSSLFTAEFIKSLSSMIGTTDSTKVALEMMSRLCVADAKLFGNAFNESGAPLAQLVEIASSGSADLAPLAFNVLIAVSSGTQQGRKRLLDAGGDQMIMTILSASGALTQGAVDLLCQLCGSAAGREKLFQKQTEWFGIFDTLLSQDICTAGLIRAVNSLVVSATWRVAFKQTPLLNAVVGLSRAGEPAAAQAAITLLVSLYYAASAASSSDDEAPKMTRDILVDIHSKLTSVESPLPLKAAAATLLSVVPASSLLELVSLESGGDCLTSIVGVLKSCIAEPTVVVPLVAVLSHLVFCDTARSLLLTLLPETTLLELQASCTHNPQLIGQLSSFLGSA